MNILTKSMLALVAVSLLLQPLQPLSAKQAGASHEQNGAAAFTDQIAAQLLDQIKDGLQSRNVKRTLDTFDLSRMSGGPAFRNQITALLNQYESIRIHFNLIETSPNGAEGAAVVDVELEENLPNDVSAPVHKRAQLRFVAQNGPKGWKFTDVQPRSFFS
jgi:hypothetical protein